MRNNPSPIGFYAAFRRVVEAKSELLLQDWSDNHKYTDVFRNTILPEIAAELNMGLRLECCTLDAAFFPENNAEAYGRYVSATIEHENEYSTTVEEMYKLQRFNTPLSVLITYPGRPKIGDRLLMKYAAIIKAADVFENATSHRRQIVIFGYKGPEWRSFVYVDGAFSSLDAAPAQGS